MKQGNPKENEDSHTLSPISPSYGCIFTGNWGTLSSIDLLSVYHSQKRTLEQQPLSCSFSAVSGTPVRGTLGGSRNSLTPEDQPRPTGNGSGLGLSRAPRLGLHDHACQFLEQISSVCLSARVSQCQPASHLHAISSASLESPIQGAGVRRN